MCGSGSLVRACQADRTQRPACLPISLSPCLRSNKGRWVLQPSLLHGLPLQYQSDWLRPHVDQLALLRAPTLPV
jgi:hypothetical protein